MLCVDFKIKWKKEDLIEVMNKKSGGNLEHDIRLWEAEAALDMRTTLEDWYKLPLIEREHIIAVRVAGRWLDNVMVDEAVRKAKQ